MTEAVPVTYILSGMARADPYHSGGFFSFAVWSDRPKKGRKKMNRNMNTENLEEIPAKVLEQVAAGGRKNLNTIDFMPMPECPYCRSNQYVFPKGKNVYWCDSCKKMFRYTAHK